VNCQRLSDDLTVRSRLVANSTVHWSLGKVLTGAKQKLFIFISLFADKALDIMADDSLSALSVDDERCAYKQHHTIRVTCCS
jgi:hypothetical protein